MSEPIVSSNRLTKVFGEVAAVRDLSFGIGRGEIFGFLGANGAGKTTTMRMLCGLLRPTSGKATIVGGDIWRDRYAVRARFGYMAQKFSLYPDLTVLENMRFFAGAYGVPPNKMEARINQLLVQMDLAEKHHTPAGELSGGMRQLLALGCALVHEPPLLFLDEPTSGLDPVHRQQMWDLLYDLGDSGITIFVTTHYMDEAERCTDVGFIDKGRLLAKASPRALMETFKAKLLELDVKPLMPALVRLRELPGVLGVSLRSGSLRIYAPEAEKFLAEWQEHWPFDELQLTGHRWAEPDMEDVFTAYSQGYDSMLNKAALA
ncbi:MAG: ABC transporter ATP-binding protein [Chthoniobacterales bacterium]|jgi:ABC-2 type transport system ATP-binding protein|nr:ABC transporter ATP-binding protein [Chthoniobacterales bacterium]